MNKLLQGLKAKNNQAIKARVPADDMPTNAQIDIVKRANDPSLEKYTNYCGGFWMKARSAMRDIVNAVQFHAVDLVPFETLRDFSNDLEEVKDFYRVRYGIEVLLIRWGDVVVRFDRNNLPKRVEELMTLIDKGAVKPEIEEVVAFYKAYPKHLSKLYPSEIKPFPIWIDNQLIVFNWQDWLRTSDVIERYLSYNYQFNTSHGWS